MSPFVVLITGANSGVGYAAAQVIASASSRYHVLLGSRNLGNGQKAAEEIAATKPAGKVEAVQIDVTDDSSIANLVTYVEKTFGRLDTLVNNAAIGNRDPDLRTRLQLSFETNVLGPAVVSEAFRPLLLKSTDPYSIYVSSGQGSLALAADPASKTYSNPIAHASGYRMSKAALNMIAIQEASLFDTTPLKVFVMCPGFVVSNLRGKDEASRTGWGRAGDPAESGHLLLNIIEGKREKDVGKLVHKDGIYPW